MSNAAPPLDGVRLRDNEGMDFLLFKMGWFLMTPETNAKALFDTLYQDFQFPFALCAQLPDGRWTFYSPDSLADSLKSIDIENLKWTKIPIVQNP